MDRINKKIAAFINGFFSVNYGAGRLRFILAVLFTFIFWTLIAQSNPGRTLMFLQPQKTAGFTESVIGEIFMRYLSPQTLLITVLPFLLFKAAKNQVALYFGSFLSSNKGQKLLQNYLGYCAFAKRKNTLSINKNTIDQSAEAFTLSKLFGGPLKMHISKHFALIIAAKKNTGFYFIKSLKHDADFQYHLKYGKKIITFLPIDNLTLPVVCNHYNTEDKGRHGFDKFRIDVTFPSPVSQAGDFFWQNLSMHDARFCNMLATNKNLISTFFRKEIEKYLRDNKLTHVQSSIENNRENNAPEEDRIQKQHKQYEYFPNRGEQPYGFIRKHRRSMYSFGSSEKWSANQEENILDDHLDSIALRNLNKYIQDQVVSFFSTDNIQIEIQEGI